MEIRVEIVGKRIRLVSQWRADLPAKCKLINGASWMKEKKAWSFPLDYGTCLDLRRVFQHELVIGPKLKKWARQEKARYEDLITLTDQDRADLAVVAEVSPALAAAMGNRPYQQVGAAWMGRARAGVLGDSPGLGKTLQTMGAIVEAKTTGGVLVFAPKTAAIVTWTNELKKWLPDDIVVTPAALGGKPRRTLLESVQRNIDTVREIGSRLWVLCNIEMARDGASPLFGIEWEGVVVDESHRALVCTSSVAAKQTQQRRGIARIKTVERGFRLALSGTPMRGKLYNLWGTLNWVRPDLYTSYWRWIDKYFETYSDGYGFIIGDLKPEMREEFDRDLKSIMLRRTKNEVLSELPEKVYAGWRLEDQDPAAAPGIWLEMPAKQRETYEMLKSSGSVSLDGGELHANGALAELTRLKQLASCTWKFVGSDIVPCLPSNKFDWLLAKLEDLGIVADTEESSDQKIIIASQFTKLIDLFAAELRARGFKCHVLTGATKDGPRADMVNEFQADGGPRIFLLNTKAGGVSLTLDMADDVVILDETWNPDDQEQVEDRAHRASRMHNVTITYLRSLGTVEEDIARQLGIMEQAQKAVLDGRRGVDFEKRAH